MWKQTHLTSGAECPGRYAQVFPEKGTVSFSAGLHGWAFTLTVFADLYAKKFGVEVRTAAAPCSRSF